LRVCVDYPGIAGIVETNGVCIREHAFAPRLKELALCTVNLDWNLASVERPHISIRRHCDARHRSPVAPWRFFERPVGVDFVSDRVIDTRVGHSVLRLSSSRNCGQENEACNPEQSPANAYGHDVLQCWAVGEIIRSLNAVAETLGSCMDSRKDV